MPRKRSIKRKSITKKTDTNDYKEIIEKIRPDIESAYAMSMNKAVNNKLGRVLDEFKFMDIRRNNS